MNYTLSFDINQNQLKIKNTVIDVLLVVTPLLFY